MQSEMRGDRVREEVRGRTFLDHSFLANQALFDRFFVSSAGAQPGGVFKKSRGAEEVLQEFLNGESRLPNSRLSVLSAPKDPAERARELADDDGYQFVAAHLGVEGACDHPDADQQGAGAKDWATLHG